MTAPKVPPADVFHLAFAPLGADSECTAADFSASAAAVTRTVAPGTTYQLIFVGSSGRVQARFGDTNPTLATNDTAREGFTCAPGVNPLVTVPAGVTELRLIASATGPLVVIQKVK